MNLFNKPSVISLLVITFISYSVVQQVHTAHVNIEVIEESDDPDSSLPKSESLTSLDTNNNNNSSTSISDTISNISAVNKSITDDGTSHAVGATASTISPNDTMLADESISSPIAFTLADVHSPQVIHEESKSRPSDLLIDSAAKSAIAALQYEASQGKVASYSRFGFPIDASASEQQIHVLPNGDYLLDTPLANLPSISPAASSISQSTAPATSSTGNSGFFSSLFSKSTPLSPVNSFISSTSSVAGASDEESRLKSFLTSTATRFPFSGFLRGSKDIKQGQINQNIPSVSQSEQQQQQQLHSIHESIVAEASNISPTSSGNSGGISIESFTGGSDVAAASDASAATTGSASNIATVHQQTQFDPVQVELGLSAYPAGESISPSDSITTAAQVNLPQGDSVSITSAGATSLGQESFTGQATSSSSQLNHHHHHFLYNGNQQQQQQQINSHNGFFGKYRSRLPRIRINPFKNVWKNSNDKNKTPIAPVNIEQGTVSNNGQINSQQQQQQTPAGPLGYFKNTEPLLSSKFTPKLPSIFLFPIKLFSTATKPLNMLIGRNKKGGKVKSISLFNKRPIIHGNNNAASNQHVIPLVNSPQTQSFVLFGDNIANGKIINDAQNQGGQPVYMFVSKNQPIESAHQIQHNAPVDASTSSPPSGSYNNAHASLSSGFISNLPSEFIKDDNNSTQFTETSSNVDAKDTIIIDESQAKNRIPFKSHLHL